MPRKKVEINPKCGKRLKTLCEQEKITQTSLAKTINLSQQVVSGIVQGRATLTIHTATAIVSHFPKYRIEWLLGIDDFMTNTDKWLSVAGEYMGGLDLAKELIEWHGYRIEEDRDTNWNRVYGSVSVTIPANADDKTILERAHNAPRNLVLRITAPDGRQLRITRRDFDAILEEIDNFAQMRMAYRFRDIKGGNDNG